VTTKIFVKLHQRTGKGVVGQAMMVGSEDPIAMAIVELLAVLLVTY
jgi:hypothetical protein